MLIHAYIVQLGLNIDPGIRMYEQFLENNLFWSHIHFLTKQDFAILYVQS